MLSRSLALIRKDIRLYLADAAPVLLMVLLPLGFIAFMVPASRALLEAQGFAGVTGAEHVLPGVMVMFALFLLGIVGDQFFREHGWGTWNRARVAADATEIMLGKVLPALVVLAGQLAVVFGAGTLLFGMRVRGSVLGLAVILGAFAVCLVAILMALVACCRTFVQFNVLNNLLVMVFAGLGGTFAPVALMPGWAQSAARFTPSYWVIEGLRGVILNGDGMGPALQTAGMTLAFAVGFAAIAALRFRTAEAKIAL